MLVQITIPHACFGIVVRDDGVITEAAPIGKWMLGHQIWYIADWVKIHNGEVIYIATIDPSTWHGVWGIKG